jgi:AraC-like DNA-binding protein
MPMNIENLPNLEAVDYGMVSDPSRPVLTLDWQAEGPHRVPGHSHPRAQIIYQCAGVYRVQTGSGSFVVPQKQAIWIPPHVYHETYTNGSARALMLFVDGSLATVLARECMVVDVSPFLAQLFFRAVEYGNQYDSSGREAHLVQVILDELALLTPSRLHLPLPRDKRLSRLIDRLIAAPALDTTLVELASGSGASGRTLARLFRRETGLTYIEWRNTLCLLEAIDRLGQGHAVTQVAMDLGYQSVSAFIAMFRREMGVSPARYIRERRSGVLPVTLESQCLSDRQPEVVS